MTAPAAPRAAPPGQATLAFGIGPPARAIPRLRARPTPPRPSIILAQILRGCGGSAPTPALSARTASRHGSAR
mgnify:CR=1 FL=1